MSIKSEKAKEYLISITEDVAVEYPFVNSDCFMIKQGDAKKAIELAEFDARERAVRAFCKNCQRMEYRGCDGTAYCQEQWEYQNDYDNDSKD